jgi:hypothetical protein
MGRFLGAAGAFAVLGAVAALIACAGDAIVVRPQAGVSPPSENGRADHSDYDALLKKYVDSRGLVDYAAWKAADRPALERYLRAMAAVQPSALADRDERLAYWINVYNACVIYGVLQFYPIKSVKEHVSHLWGFDFWTDVRIEVEKKEQSLDSIEHAILRKMGEPRIHFAIVCASLGCPRLRNHAYSGERLGAELDENARDFFGNPEKFRIDRKKKIVYLSKIMKWFGEDFGGTDRAKLDFAARFASSDEDRAFLERKDLEVRYLDYDWEINDKAEKP